MHKTDFVVNNCLSPRANQILAQPPDSGLDLAPSDMKPTRQPHDPLPAGDGATLTTRRR
jgi:hypothetical protein